MKESEFMHCIILPRQDRGGLYLGNIQCAQDKKNLDKYGIKAVITVTSTKEVQFDSSIFHLHLKVTDYESDQIQKFFAQSNNFLDLNRRYTNVLVHCRMGISRSATIVIAYLMYYKRLSLQQAFDYVKGIRSCIQPNKGFMSQLMKYEIMLNQRVGSPQTNIYNGSPIRPHLRSAYQPVRIESYKIIQTLGPSFISTSSSPQKLQQQNILKSSIRNQKMLPSKSQVRYYKYNSSPSPPIAIYYLK